MKVERSGKEDGLLGRSLFKITGITRREIRLIQGCMSMFKFNGIVAAIKPCEEDRPTGTRIYDAIETGLNFPPE